MVKWLFKLCFGPELVSISPPKSSFREKKKETKNVKTNILTDTPLIFLNLENILIVLHTKIPKLNDKKKFDIVFKMLQENDILPKPISTSLR